MSLKGYRLWGMGQLDSTCVHAGGVGTGGELVDSLLSLLVVLPRKCIVQKKKNSNLE
jgi:hypothetical protein